MCLFFNFVIFFYHLDVIFHELYAWRNRHPATFGCKKLTTLGTEFIVSFIMSGILELVVFVGKMYTCTLLLYFYVHGFNYFVLHGILYLHVFNYLLTSCCTYYSPTVNIFLGRFLDIMVCVNYVHKKLNLNVQILLSVLFRLYEWF